MKSLASDADILREVRVGDLLGCEIVREAHAPKHVTNMVTAQQELSPPWRLASSPERRHVQGMKGKYPNGLKAAMARKGLGPTEMGRLAGEPKQNISRWADGERQLKPDVARKLAPLLDVEPESLVFAERADLEDFGIVPVIGEIAAGGRIDVQAEDFSQAEPLYEIKVPFQFPSDAIALRVNGDSMWPRYDPGDVIICYRYSEDPTPLIGFEAAIGTPDGNRFLKRLLKGSQDGLYNLESHNAGLMKDVQVAWVSEVYGVVRAARWQKLSDAERRKAMRRAVA